MCGCARGGAICTIVIEFRVEHAVLFGLEHDTRRRSVFCKAAADVPHAHAGIVGGGCDSPIYRLDGVDGGVDVGLKAAVRAVRRGPVMLQRVLGLVVCGQSGL